MPRRNLEAASLTAWHPDLPGGFVGYMHVAESELEIDDVMRRKGLDSVTWTIHDPVTDADITASFTPTVLGMLDDVAEDFVLGMTTAEVVAEGITIRPLRVI